MAPQDFGHIPKRSFRFCSFDHNPGYDKAQARPEGSKARIPEECDSHPIVKACPHSNRG